MALRKLPFEIIATVAINLDLDDIFSLSLTCRQFSYLIREESICKDALEFSASFTPEAKMARESRRYAAGLRRLVKRKAAISSASPYVAALVAVAESWIYAHGILCYTLEGRLRALNLQGSSATETVIDIQTVLRQEIPDYVETRKNKFQLLHYAEGVISCLYYQGRPAAETWLVVLGLDKRSVLTTRLLESSHKLFVRNDQNYLYFGTHSDIGEDDYRRWVLQGYSFEDREWFEQKIHLLDMVGSDIGASICFDIIDGHFYGLSNQTSFEAEELDWTSFYHCFKFPVDSPKPKHTQISCKKAMWRRQHAEGPIDDRWTFMRLFRDERTGSLRVLESRKEWLSGQRSGRRTYYMTDLVFPQGEEEPSLLTGGSSTGELSPDSIGSSYSCLKATTATSDPTEMVAPPRCPYSTHVGDDASSSLLFTFSKCFALSYHPVCQAFLDLVDDPAPSDPNTQRLRLRVGARRLRPLAERRDKQGPDEPLSAGERIKRLFVDDGKNSIAFWPDEAQPDPPLQSAIDDLYRVLNPPTFTGNVRGTWDDTSLVYSTGGADNGLQALVFLSFDPACRLPGLPRWTGLPAQKEKTAGHATRVDTVRDLECDAKEKGKGKAKEAPWSARESARDTSNPSSPPSGRDGEHPVWAWSEEAMYATISSTIPYGYTLAR